MQIFELFEKPRPDIISALQSAARSGHVDVIKRLLDVRSTDRSPAPLDIIAVINAAEECGDEVLVLILYKESEELECNRQS